MKTRAEVETLKQQWLKDPCWDLDTTEGFEEYKEELAQFQAEFIAASKKKLEARTEILQQKWYELKLNESFRLDNYTSVTRVPGGWIYNQTTCTKEPSSRDYDDAEHMMISTFIPYAKDETVTLVPPGIWNPDWFSYSTLFNAIAAATSTKGQEPINISVKTFERVMIEFTTHAYITSTDKATS